MRKFFVWAMVILALISAGCSASRKPVPQPQSKTYVVPDVSKVDFDVVKLKDCPKVVRDVAGTIRDRRVNTWVQSDNNAYILASTGKNTGNTLEVDQILQRIPQQGINWLDVKLKPGAPATGQQGTATNVTVVRAKVSDRPEGVGFEVTEEATTGEAARTVPQTPIRPTPISQGTPQSDSMMMNTGAEITEPAPNQEVTSPLKVSGKLKAPAQNIRLRLVTRNGQVMKEVEVPAPGGDGIFGTSMSYNAPSLPRRGMVEVISVDPSGNDKLLARVPVLIK